MGATSSVCKEEEEAVRKHYEWNAGPKARHSPAAFATLDAQNAAAEQAFADAKNPEQCAQAWYDYKTTADQALLEDTKAALRNEEHIALRSSFKDLGVEKRVAGFRLLILVVLLVVGIGVTVNILRRKK